jgi:hypothetical protein
MTWPPRTYRMRATTEWVSGSGGGQRQHQATGDDHRAAPPTPEWLGKTGSGHDICLPTRGTGDTPRRIA